MRLFDIIKSANHNLFRNKVRTFLTIFAIVVGSFTIIMSTAINAGVNNFIDAQVESIGGDGFLEIMPKEAYNTMAEMMASSGEIKEYNPEDESKALKSIYITDDDIARIKAVDGVKNASEYHVISLEYVTSDKTDKKYRANASAIPSESINIDLSTGRNVDVHGDAYEVVIPPDYVEKLGFKSDEDIVGEKITLVVEQVACQQRKVAEAQAKALAETDAIKGLSSTRGAAESSVTTSDADVLEACAKEVQAEVVGVQAPGVLINSGSIGMNLALDDELYELMMADDGSFSSGDKGTVMAFADVEVDKVDEVVKKLDEMGYSAMTIDDEVGAIRSFFDVVLVVLDIFGVIALFAATIGVVNTLFMSVSERKKEIGLGKAVGMTNGKIYLSFLIEAILLGFWGSVVGIALSMLIGFGFNSLAHESFLADFPTFNLVVFEPVSMLIVAGAIMLVTCIAGTLPARKAARENPIEALRSE